MVEFYAYEDLGFIIDPESDTKEVFIPSPPTMVTAKINPRPAIIYITGGKVVEGYDKLETMKDYAEKNKVVIVCPTAEDAEELGKTYEYVSMKAKLLNVKKDQISIKGDADHMDLAQEAVDYAVDEMDADLDDAEELDF
ncbi:MAG: hypothetical protein ACLSES_04665 [Christensenellales bacterium]|jgi:hypothetical protein